MLNHTCECYICHREMVDTLGELQKSKAVKAVPTLLKVTHESGKEIEFEALKTTLIQRVENAAD